VKTTSTPLAELITVTAADGLMLPALYYQPKTTTKRLVIWLHGMGSSGIFYSTAHTNALAAAFTGSGTAFLGLQNRGGGMLQGIKYLDEAGEKQKRTGGTTHELIAECVHDVDGAVSFAKSQGCTELYLAGHSTGANKIALYSYLKPKNDLSGYVLYGGGDDTGMFYEDMGPESFKRMLEEAKHQTEAGHGADLAPVEVMGDYFSYQSAYDILNPDGGYNTFPFYEAQNKRLGTKELWREYKSLNKPTLVIYGAADEYCRPSVSACLDILKREAPAGVNFSFQTIPGGDHGCYRHEPELAEAIAGWVKNPTK
jgi:pimeloyl-ACP methyl ester carboxylesterase